jgi:hypothetical protein
MFKIKNDVCLKVVDREVVKLNGNQFFPNHLIKNCDLSLLEDFGERLPNQIDANTFYVEDYNTNVDISHYTNNVDDVRYTDVFSTIVEGYPIDKVLYILFKSDCDVGKEIAKLKENYFSKVEYTYKDDEIN